MIEVKGQHTDAVKYTDNPQEVAILQIKELVNQSFMPDYHAGKGCVIGTTISLNNRVVPNLVGVDVGCGVLVSEIGMGKVDFNKFDETILQFIPSGNEIHENADKIKLTETYTNRSLGGGNHFIELAQDDMGVHYLLIHTGSRYVGGKGGKLASKTCI